MSDTKNIFIDLAIKHGEAIESGDYKLANKIHTKLTSTYQEIKRDNKWQELKEITQHLNENVKLWSATFLLNYDTDTALKVLNEVSKSNKIFGLSASTTIDMWNKGMLQL